MSSGRRRRLSSYKSHPLYGTITKNSFSIDLNKKASAGFTLYRIVFKVSFLVGMLACFTNECLHVCTGCSPYNALNTRRP